MRRLLVAAAAGAIALALLPVPALADPVTSVTFGEPSYESPYGTTWVMSARVEITTDRPGYTLGPGVGLVDFYLDGNTTPYKTGVPLSDDGQVYVAQRSDQDYLAPGQHTVRAVFTPTPDYGLTTAESSAVLTVAPIALSTQAKTERADVDSAVVAVTASGTALDVFHGMPAGVWTVSASAEGVPTVETSAAQEQGSTSELSLTLVGLAPGTNYSLASTFAPHESLAAGIEIENAPPSNFSTGSTGFVGFIQSGVPAEPWVVVMVSGLLVALLAAAIVLAARSRRRARAVAQDDSDIR